MRLDRVGALLMDMDGTLVDSRAAVERAWCAWAREYGVPEPDALALAHLGPAPMTVQRLRGDLDQARLAEAAARQLVLQYDDLADVSAADGAAELLAVLAERGLPWAVVTGADRRLARARLAAARIAAPVLITGDDVTANKPAPDGYLLAARRLGVPTAACLAVEDSATGASAARAAGMPVATLPGVAGDLPVSGLRQLAGLLAAAGDRPAPPAVDHPPLIEAGRRP